MLTKFQLKKDTYDTEIQSDFFVKPIIPVKTFMAILKSMLETQGDGKKKADGLEHRQNIFHVDLKEIGDGRVITVFVYYGRDTGWWISASEFDSEDLWGKKDLWGKNLYFFAPTFTTS